MVTLSRQKGNNTQCGGGYLGPGDNSNGAGGSVDTLAGRDHPHTAETQAQLQLTPQKMVLP